MKKLLQSVTLLFSFIVSQHCFGQKVSRGPYLQVGTSTSIIIRWNTDLAQATRLIYGENYNAKSTNFIDSQSQISHSAKLLNLKANTKYYYSVVMDDGTLVGDESYYFITSPLDASVQKMKFVALGDCGTNTPAQTLVMNQIENYFGTSIPNGILLLGDNAYNSGFDSEFQTNFFDKYQGTIIKNSAIWPCPGNHDYSQRLVWPNDFGALPPYYSIFTMPTNAESGGVASNSQAYYSFNQGNIHFVSLDSYGSYQDGKRMSDTLSNQIVWLKKDLAANTKMWTVVYFHHPPFTKGSHNSDTEQELIDIRKNLVKVLENNKVDLVLNGHSHTYERSFPIHDFYGNSESFSATLNAASSSSGKFDGSANSCPYVKNDKSIVYVVAGTSGWTGVTSEGYPHHAMYYSNPTNQGALILEVENNRLDAKYLTETGEIKDKFTLLKNVNKNTTKTVACGEKFTLPASWSCTNTCNGVNTVMKEFTLDSLNQSKSYLISDQLGCIKDTIKVVVTPYPAITASSNSPLNYGASLLLNSTFSGLGKQTWIGPNSFTADGLTATISNVSANNAGVYTVQSSYKTCVSTASITVVITALPLGITTSDSKGLDVSPNPFLNQIKVKFNIPKEGNYQFSMLDINGVEQINSQAKYYQTGDYEEMIQVLHTLSDGVYVLRIMGDDYSKALKLIK